MIDENKVHTLVKTFTGIPYRHGGRSLDGLDCLGLIYLFYKKWGIEIPEGDGKAYSPTWYKEDPQRFRRGIENIGKPVSPLDLQPLDLVYFRIGGAVTHAGVMIDRNHFLHVLKDQVVHLAPLNAAWRRRLVGARRLL